LGIIAFRASEHDQTQNSEVQNILDSLPDVVPPSTTNNNNNNNRVLMVQRRDSLGYINVLRPRQEEHGSFLTTYARDMTPKERKRLEDNTFKDLWADLAMNKQCRWYNKEMDRAEQKFAKLDLHGLLDSTTSKWHHLEWGFPKGKRNLYEDDLTSALREFQEETGYSQDDLTLIQREPLIERFVGLNNNEYMCKYFVAWMNPNRGPPEINPENPYQAGEVSNLAWLRYDEAMKIIRPTAKNKREVLTQAYLLTTQKK
jgi:8-oxo-dGTP pyrophosphatase MutT (NUDIX family)